MISNVVQGNLLEVMTRWGKPITRSRLRDFLGGRNHVSDGRVAFLLKALRAQGKVRRVEYPGVAQELWEVVEAPSPKGPATVQRSPVRAACEAAWAALGKSANLPDNFEALEPGAQKLWWPDSGRARP